MLGKSDNYVLAVRFPRIWQTNILLSCVYSIAVSIGAIVVCIANTGDLKADAIPENIVGWFRFFLFASAIATLFWFFRSMRHFRVGVAGYKVASPPLLMLFIVITMIWVPPFVYAYCASSALKSTASSEQARVGYLRLLRVASLFDAQSHYEPMVPNIGQLESPESFTIASVNKLAEEAVRPVELFAPEIAKNELLNLLQTSIPACSANWSTISKAEEDNAANAAANERSSRAQTEEEREAARKERASKLDSNVAVYQKTNQKFQQCLSGALVHGARNESGEIKRAFYAAERNAYLVQYAHESFGQNSTDYLYFYRHDTRFVAPELFPFGLGDVTVLSVVAWMAFLISVYYLAGEYVDSSSFASAVRNIILVALIVALLLSSFSTTSSLPSLGGNAFIFDDLASALHWPALAVITIGVIGLLKMWIGPSTHRTRFVILMTFLCVPVAIGIETLNAVNTLASVDYRGGNCPRLSWILADQTHCLIYSMWQPIVRTGSVWLADHLGWPSAWSKTGGRVAISAILSIAISLPISSIILVALKREFVRPRDR